MDQTMDSSAIDADNPVPLYVQIADKLRKQIYSGELQKNDRLPTELELCDVLSVSRGTVRQAIGLLVQEGLFSRVKGKGTFVSNTEVRKNSSLVGVVVPYLRDGLTNAILSGLESVLRTNRFNLVLSHSDGDPAIEQEQVTRLLSEGVAGVVLFPVSEIPEGGHSVITEIPESVPIVLVDRSVSGAEATVVSSANYQGGYKAVSYLLENGHTRIACVATKTRPSSVVNRVDGYEQAMLDHGLFPLAALSIETVAQSSAPQSASLPRYESSDFPIIDRLLDNPSPPTALFCINDYLAIGVMEHLRERDVRVPEDISIVGFDNVSFSSYGSISLTTVAQPAYEIGVQAGTHLLKQLTEGKRLTERITLDVELVIRSSTRTITQDT